MTFVDGVQSYSILIGLTLPDGEAARPAARVVALVNFPH